MAWVLILTCAVSALVGATAVRLLVGNKLAQREHTRNVESERLISWLSGRQPGIWDHDELRNRVGEVASRYWSADTPAALRQLQQWVHPSMVEAQLARWPEGAQRRDGRVELITPPAFVHVVEGAPSGDRLIARLEARIAQDFFDAQGRCIRTERHPPEFSYHHWRHIDGQGWQLEGITAHFPRGEAPPSSVACGLAAVAQEDA